jgi:hypothetical protein
MITVFKFEKSSNSHIRSYIVDQVTINYKVLSLLYVEPYESRPAYEAGFFKDVNENSTV